MKFDANGSVLECHDRDDEVDTRSPQRVRFTHKQPDERTGMGTTDNTVARRAKLSESPSSSSSSHEMVPKLHDSSGETADADLGESARKKIRVDTGIEISAIEILTSAKLEVDRALDTANTTLHRSQEEALQPPFESKAVTKAAELQIIKDKEVYTKMYESDTKEKVISSKWVLKPRKTRYVLRGFEEHVKDEDAFIENAALSCDRPKKRRSHCVHCRRENRLLQRKHEGRRRGVRKTTIRVTTGDTGSHQGYCDLETSEEFVWSEKGTKTLAEHGGYSQKVRFLSQTCSTLACGPTRRSECHLYSTSTICCWLERARPSQKSSPS